MNNIGLLIKMSRIQQNMKQVTLAKGICSTSYLSKIENNQTVPSDDVLELLLSRLELDFDELSTDDEETFLNDVFKLYKVAIVDRNKEKIFEKLSPLVETNILFKESKNYYLYHLYLQRINMIIDFSDDKLEKSFLYLSDNQEIFDDRQRFIFNLNYGVYYYLNNDYKNSQKMLERALNVLSKFKVDNWELADFYNILSLANLSSNQLLKTIEYAKKSLEIYKDLLIFNRAIDCYIIIGIAHRKNLDYKNAEESFLLAQKIVSDLNLQEYDSMLNHNLGSLASVKGNYDNAINFYNKSLESSLSILDSLTIIFSIIQEYSKKKNAEEVITWCNKGLSLITDKNNPRFQPYVYHFNLYIVLYDIKIKDKEKTMLDTVVYFEKIEDLRHAHKYSIILAEYYAINRKYKNSSLFFNKANFYLYKLKSINKWEDL